MGKKRLFLTVPLFTPTLSRLWVRLITGASKELVYPLIVSLKYPMVARPDHIYKTFAPGRKYSSLLDTINFDETNKAPSRGSSFRAQRKTVRSVQRLPLPNGRDAEWVKDQYASWLPKFCAPLVKVTNEGSHMRFFLLTSKAMMLDLAVNAERSTPDRQLLYVEGGLLAAADNSGRLEFRVVLQRKYVLAAIHNFKPSLPWPLYKVTQAVAHLWVMHGFSNYLARQR